MCTVFLARDGNSLTRQRHSPRPNATRKGRLHCPDSTPLPPKDKFLHNARGALYYPHR